MRRRRRDSRRDENLLGVDLEGIAVDRAIEHERGDEAREP